MGLTICVGLSSEIREDDPEYAEYLERQLAAVNDILESFGLPAHAEPPVLEDEQTFECDMYGYSGLHRLRRVAAHLALKGEAPPPGDVDAADDPVLNDYHKIFDASFAQGKSSEMPFQHLIVHSDAEGYYVPVEFEDVLIPDASLEIAGGMIGSSHTLLRECRELAQVLEIPEGLSVEDLMDEELEGREASEMKWERYGVETYTCLALIRACEASIGAGAAIVFA